MLELVVAIHSKQITSLTDGSVTVSVVAPIPVGLMCDLDGGGSRAAIVGDVYSPQPNGSLRARPAGTAGAWERAIINGSVVVWAPSGAAGAAYILPFAAKIPNF